MDCFDAALSKDCITPGARAMSDSDVDRESAWKWLRRIWKRLWIMGECSYDRSDIPSTTYIAGIGILKSWVRESFTQWSHPLGAFYDTPYGVANALLLPCMYGIYCRCPAVLKYIIYRQAMGVGNRRYEWWRGVKSAIEACAKSLSLRYRYPAKLHEINVQEEISPALAVAAFNDVLNGW